MNKTCNNFKKNERDIYFYNNLGYLYSICGDYTKMKNAYIEAIEKDSDDFELHYNLGYAYIKLKMYNEALNSFEIAIQLKSNLLAAYYYRGDILLRVLKQQNKALINYQTANIIFPKDTYIINLLAFCLENENKLNDALDCYNKGILLDNSNFELFYNKGLCLNKLGLHSEALVS